MAEYNVLFTMGRILLLLFLSFTFVHMQISDKRLCADKECKVVISTVKALARHIGDHPLLLTFAAGDVFSVYSKSAGNNPHLWGGEVNGHRGYFDKNFVQEIKVFVEHPEHEVDTEGNIFERLGKPPPSVDEKIRRKKFNLDNTEEAGISAEKKEEAQKDSAALPTGDSDKVKDVKENNESEDKKVEEKELKKDEAVDDLLKMTETLDEGTENIPQIFNIKDNDASDDDAEKRDSEELNSFLKNKLLPGNPGKADGDIPSDKEQESLKVEPEASQEAGENIHEAITNVKRQEVSEENKSSKDVDKSEKEDGKTVDAPTIFRGVDDNTVDASKISNGEDSNSVDAPTISNGEDSNSVDAPEITNGEDNSTVDATNITNGQDNSTVDVPDITNGEDNSTVDATDITNGEENSTVDTPDITNGEENSTVDAPGITNGEDNNKVDDLSHNAKSVSDSDAPEGTEVKVNDDEKESSKQKTVENTHVDLEVDDPTELDESTPEEFDLNKAEVIRGESLKDAAESNGKPESKTVEKEKSATGLKFKSEDDVSNDGHSSETEGTNEINRGEETVSKDKMKEDVSVEAVLKHDLKVASESSEAQNGDKEDTNAKKDEAGDRDSDEAILDKIPTAEHEPDGSDVAPDTLLDASSPEVNQKLDPVASEADTSLEEGPGLSNEGGGKSEKESSTSESSTVDQVDREDEKFIGAGFLLSSRAQLDDSDLPRETPKLNINPTSAFISEKISDSESSQVEIESSKTEVVATGNKSDKKLADTEELVTIEEGGSTIVINKEGEVVTAILPQGQVSQTSDDVALTSSIDVGSVGKLDPTAVASMLKPSQSLEEPKRVDPESLQGFGNDNDLSNTNASNIQLENSDKLVDNKLVNRDYQSADFNSRKVLSVDHSAATLQQQQPQHLASEQQPSEEQKQQKFESVIPTPVVSPLSKLNSEMSSLVSETSETPGESLGDADKQESNTDKEHSSAGGTGGHINQELLPDQQEQPDGAPKITEAATEVPIGHVDLPPSENSVGSAQTPEDTSAAPEDYSADQVYHSRKINYEDLLNEEEQKLTEPSQGFFKKIVTAVESQTKNLLDKLPPSLQSVLDSFGLVTNMKLVVITFAVALLISMTFISCCSSGGSNKKLQQQMLVKFDELEKKRLIDVKEKQNMEDEITSKEAKNIQMKAEIEKLKEEAKKNKSELQTIQLHNETMKKQLTSFQSQVEELKENASSKQGEVKQHSKKTKDLEKQIKKLEERERNLEQTAQKLTSDLKHKEEEVVLLTSKIAGFTDLVGHLQTSKDQLLAEADDWKEKVSDLKDRLEQREEEFKQMQETIMFKESELEVLKDCFLQLKAFEEVEEGEEDAENVSARVQEKIASMMDVSKMNASLRALEEEKNSLANKLKIELEARRELEEQLESSRRSLETSMTDKMKAERQYQEAQTKFNVLSSYFKEKEMQLQRELGEHEALKKQNLNKLVNADETTKSVQQELDFIRTQNESLKRELASSERDFRSQIAANEKKAHENWLAARAAERELKEARHEAGVLRQKLTDIERRQFMGPGGLIRPLPTRIPPTGIMNGPPPPGMERSPSRGSLPPMPPIPPPHLRDEDFLASRGDRGHPPFPLDMRRGPLPPPGMRPPLDARSPPPRLPPFGSAHSPPPRMPPPGMMDGRSPPPYDRRLPPHHLPDRRSPPFRLPPDMLPPPMRGGPLPPHYLGHGRGGSPPGGPDSPHLGDGRYPLPPYGRNPPHPSDRPSPKQSKQMSPQQSQV